MLILYKRLCFDNKFLIKYLVLLYFLFITLFYITLTLLNKLKLILLFLTLINYLPYQHRKMLLYVVIFNIIINYLINIKRSPNNFFLRLL